VSAGLRALGAGAASVAILASGAALVVAADRWPVGAAPPAPPVVVDVAAGRTTLVCPGPPVLPAGADQPADPGFDPTPEETATVVTLASLGREGGSAAVGRHVAGLDLDAGAEATPLAPVGAPAATATVDEITGVGRVELEPAGGRPALAGAAVLARTPAGDLRGLAGATCRPAAASAWLVAGATTVGSSARLVVANPGATPATVTLSLWGATGPLDPGQAGTLLVPAGEEESLLLEGVAPDQTRLAVHLTATGGQVATWVQDSELRGFVPAGTDHAAPTADPATRVVVPGLAVAASSVEDADAALVRVVNPGTGPATVGLRLLGPDGAVAVPGAEETVVEAGSVTDISLAGVPAGAYAAELVSDVPVTAAGMLVRVGAASRDDPDQAVLERAWTPAAEPASASAVVLPSVGRPAVGGSVLVTNPGEQEVTLAVQPILPDGTLPAPVETTVPGLTTRPLAEEVLDGAVAVVVTAEDGILASAVRTAAARDGELLTVLPGSPDLASDQSVAVRPPRP
jgi:hypothetical protein